MIGPKRPLTDIIGTAPSDLLIRAAADTLYQPLTTIGSSLSALPLTGNGLKVLRVNASGTGLELVTAASNATWGSITGSILSQTDLQTALSGKASTTHNHDDLYQPLDAQLTDLAALSYSGNALKVIRVNAAGTGLELATASGGGTWGSITGTLSSQTDLQTALDAKASTSALTSGLAGKEATISAGTTAQYWRGDKSWQTLNATAVGLGNVSNTAQQPLDATLTAVAGLSWSAGTQVPVMTAADTFSLLTVGSATGNLLDKAAGDSLYLPKANPIWTGRLLNSSTAAITLASSGLALQVGPSTGTNIVFDAFGMQSRNNGAANTLNLNLLGGATAVGGALTVTGAISGSNLSGTNTGDQNLAPYLLSATAATTYQPLNSYLTTISGFTLTGNEGQVIKVNDTGDGFVLAADATGSGGGGTTTNAITFNNSGTGVASGSTFDGSSARTISYNSVGAQVAGSYSTTGHAHLISDVTSLQDELDAKALLSGGNEFDGAQIITADTATLTLKSTAGIPTATGGIAFSDTDSVDYAWIGNLSTSQDTLSIDTYSDDIIINGQTGVTLKHGNSAKLATGSGGVSVTGTLGASGAVTGSNLSGTNTGDQTITLTGNVTGSGTGSFATTIAAGVVTLANMANMATSSLIYRKTAGSGAPEVNTLATLKTDLGLTGTNSGDQTITLTGNVTGSGTGSFATTIASNVVTNAMLSTVATATFKGRTTASTGNVEDLTATQATALLNTFGGANGSVGGLKGLVPATAATDNTKYLKGDGTWATVSSGITNVQADTAPTLGGDLNVNGYNLVGTGGVKIQPTTASIYLYSPDTTHTLIIDNSSITFTGAVGISGKLALGTYTNSSPANGDIWFDGTTLKKRIGGVTTDLDTGGGGGTTTNAVTFAASGGAAAGSTFDGSAARTIDYSTVGAAAASHTHAQSDITNLVTDLAAKAPLASPTFTGTVTAPTLSNSTGIAANTGSGDLTAIGTSGNTFVIARSATNVNTGFQCETGASVYRGSVYWDGSQMYGDSTSGWAFNVPTGHSATIGVNSTTVLDVPSTGIVVTGTTTTSTINNASGVNVQYNGSTKLATVTGGVNVTGALSATSTITAPTGTTSIASLNIPHGAAPTSPTNGDVWTTTSGLFVRLNGATASLTGTHSGTSSGTNTGDQTITLTGNVTGSGTGSFATTVVSVPSTALPVQGFGIGVSGKSTNAARYPTRAPYAFTATTGNCAAVALVAATASTVYTIKKGTVASPTTVGTATFAAAGTTATMSITAGSISAGDTVWVEAPATADTTLADISFLIRA